MTLTSTPLLLALSLLQAGGEQPLRADWPQFRGPDRTGISREVGILRDWPTDGPEILWRVRGGSGYSGVSVVGRRLFTAWDEGGEQHLVCLDAEDGKVLWKLGLGVGFEHSYGDGPRSTPLVDQGIVFMTGTQGSLVAVDAETGDLRWRHDLVEDYGCQLPVWGYSSSPLLVGERLFVETGGESAAYAAFDRETGKPLWSVQGDALAYSSPMAVSIAGVEQVLFWSARALHAVAPASGEELWNVPWSTDCAVTGAPMGTGTPLVVAPDRLFLSSGVGSALVRISRADGEFATETLWESRALRNDVNSSLLIGDHVYGFDLGTFACLEASTGEVQWKARGYRKGSLIAADGLLIVLSEDGTVALVEAKPDEFIERSHAPLLEGRNWTAPTLAAGRLYLRNHEELVCVNMMP